MPTEQNLSVIIQILTLAGICWAVYNSLKTPQEKTEKEEININNKAEALAQQVQWQKEVTATRFSEMQESFYKILEVNQNHLHTLESKLDKHIEDNTMANLTNTANFAEIKTLLQTHLK